MLSWQLRSSSARLGSLKGLLVELLIHTGVLAIHNHYCFVLLWCLRMTLLVWLFSLCVGWSSAVPPGLLGGTEVGHHVYEGLKAPQEQQEQVKTIRVRCHPNSLEVIVKADMFDIGAPVYSDELRLGAEQLDHCRAQPSLGDEYTILMGLEECGTKHWVTGMFCMCSGVATLAEHSCSSGD